MSDMGRLVTANTRIDSIIKTFRDKPGGLLSVLEEVQRITQHSFLRENDIRYISRKMGVPLSRMYSVITFYSFFNLNPQGDHSIIVCRGTACHTRGSRALLTDLMIKLGLKEEDNEGESSFTTDDKRFTIRTVACFGQCALAPVIAVDGVIHSNMTYEKLEAIVRKLSAEKSGKGRKKK